MAQRRGRIELSAAFGTDPGVLEQIPAWMRSDAQKAGLTVLHSFLDEVRADGMRFVCTVTGPVDLEQFMLARQSAILATLRSFDKHGVLVPQGSHAKSVPAIGQASGSVGGFPR